LVIYKGDLKNREGIIGSSLEKQLLFVYLTTLNFDFIAITQ